MCRLCENLDTYFHCGIMFTSARERENMSRKKYYMILDTETSSDARVVYDIAYTIIDRKGNIVEQANYLVKEWMEHPFLTCILANDKYSARKYEQFYAERYANEKKMVLPFLEIRRRIRKAVREWDCIVMAYNVEFDYTALNRMADALGKKSFFTKSTEIWDLQRIALYILCDSNRYTRFCDEHKIFTDNGNRQCGAEAVYRYITKDAEFKEAHTALADTEIEAEIFIACVNRRKKLHTEFVGQVFRHHIWKARCKR